MKVALISLGKMGREIAINLLRAGHQLTVYNRTEAKARELEARGAKTSASPAAAAAGADAVLNMVFDDAAVEQVTFGSGGILDAMPESSVHVCLSTIGIPLAKRLEQEHRRRNRYYVSAPVMGRPDAARDAKLIVFAAGSTDAIEKVRPLFDRIGRATFIAGASAWQANLFKVSANFMISSMLETFAEAQALVQKAGCDRMEFLAAMIEFWQSPIYRNYGSLIANGQFDPPGATLMLGIKDNGLVLDAATELAVPMPVASVVRDQMLSAVAAGNAELDWSSLADTAFRNAGLKPDRP